MNGEKKVRMSLLPRFVWNGAYTRYEYCRRLPQSMFAQEIAPRLGTNSRGRPYLELLQAGFPLLLDLAAGIGSTKCARGG